MDSLNRGVRGAAENVRAGDSSVLLLMSSHGNRRDLAVEYF